MSKQDLQTKAGAVVVGGTELTIGQVVDVALGRRTLALSNDREWQARIQQGADYLDRLLREDNVIYGVTTGYGDSCTTAIPADLVRELPHHLVRFHGVGMGRILDRTSARAVLVARLCSLARGFSGVRLELLGMIADLIEHDIIPAIPEEGSVGASGDLTPLSYLAAVLIGEREVLSDSGNGNGHGNGNGSNGTNAPATRPALEALQERGLEPLHLRPKEGLALMNGTAVMTGLGCLAFSRAEYLSRLCARITSLAVLALQGNRHHFDEKLFEVKPHPGQIQTAARIRMDLPESHSEGSRLQDRYSLRCAPHVIGVLEDGLQFLGQVIERELNSANDNPIIDGEGEEILHGGHFYGGHIAFAMDSLKNLVANLSDLLDRQLALLVDTKFNNGLPPNLTAAEGDRRNINHGFKAAQIAVSAWTAEALKLTMPASVFSRSTECHNQDKVSMGTISARDCIRVLELTEQSAAVLILATSQALALRERAGQIAQESYQAPVAEMLASIRADFPMIVEDAPMDASLHTLVARIREQSWDLYGAEVE